MADEEGYLTKWWVWALVIFFFLVVVYLYTRITGQGIREATRTRSQTDTTRTRRLTTVWKGGVATPMLEALTETENDEDIDFTPQLPRHIPEYLEGYNEATAEKRQSKGEAECLRVMQKFFPETEWRVQVRPKALRNPATGRRLELDILGYVPSLGRWIAVEYDGWQHYRFVKKFHRTRKDLVTQIYRDKVKTEWCESQGIWLIRVPPNVPTSKIEGFIDYFLPESVRAREEMLEYK